MANGQITVTFRKDKKVVKELSRDMHPDELVQFEGLIFDPEFPKATISSTFSRSSAVRSSQALALSSCMRAP